MVRKMLAWGCTVCLAGIGFSAVEPSGNGVAVGTVTMDLAAAKAKAKELRMPVLLSFSGSDWCDWCKLMEANVFSKPEWQTFAKGNLLLALIDFPHDKTLVPESYVERNERLKAQYGVAGFPVYVLLDCDGETVLGKLGADQGATPDSFSEQVRALARLGAAEVERYVAGLAEKEAATYRSVVAAVLEARQQVVAQEALAAAAMRRAEALGVKVQEGETAAREFRVAQRSAEVKAEYTRVKADLATSRGELDAWLKTKPERSEETMATFMRMKGSIQANEARLTQY